MKRYFVYTDEKSNKFWQIEVADNEFTVTYGKVDTEGQSKTKQFDTKEESKKEAEKLIKEKINKGYKEKVKTGEKKSTTSVKKSAVKNKINKEVESKNTFYTVENLEKNFNVKLPNRLKKFIDTQEYLQYNDKYVWDIPSPFHGSDHGYEKYKVKFDTKDILNLFNENDIEMPNDENNYYIPIMLLAKDEPEFLAINISKDNLPVALWNHETGLFHDHIYGFDEFLKNLLDKNEKTPYDELEKCIEKVKNLMSDKKDKAALKAFDSMSDRTKNVIFSYDPTRKKSFDDPMFDLIKDFFEYRGICNERINNIDQAIEDYQIAINQYNSSYAGLNLVDLLRDTKKDFIKALDIAENQAKKKLDSYCLFYNKNYLGSLYILTNNRDKAIEVYQQILNENQNSSPKSVLESKTLLEEVIKIHSLNSLLANEILTWLIPKKYEISEEEKQKNRKWWNELDQYGKSWKEAVMQNIEIDHEPTDEELAKFLAEEKIDFKKDIQITDATPFYIFKNLKWLYFYGKVNSLEVFNNLPSLKSVAYNGDYKGKRDFKIINEQELITKQKQNDLNELLIKAAEEGNLELVKKLLQEGANVNTRNRYGATSFFKAVLGKHEEVAYYLIEQGADIYMQGSDDDDIFRYCGDERGEIYKNLYTKAGGIKIDSGFRVIRSTQVPGYIVLGNLQVASKEYDKITDGVPIELSKVKDAYLEMRKDYPGYKKDTKLVDCFCPYFYVEFLIGNTKVKNFFEKHVIQNTQIFPVKILDHNRKPINEPYFLIYPFSIDCLDIEKSQLQYNVIDPDMIEELHGAVIDEKKLTKEINFFKIKDYSKEFFFRKELAEEIEKKAFTGIEFKEKR